MGVDEVLPLLRGVIEDPDEEAFLLFTSPIPSSNLGFLDSKAKDLEISLAGRDLLIRQSPGLLNSNLSGGTTGAVVWKVTPAFAKWIADPQNILTRSSVLSSTSTVIELGAGVAGLVAIALGPHVAKYLATDQNYVLKTLHQNIKLNWPTKSKTRNLHDFNSAIEVFELDWESSSVSDLPVLIPELQSTPEHVGGLDLVIACDCIYNESLIPSFVDTCAELCRLRQNSQSDYGPAPGTQSPTICIVAQQLRSATVFEEWLRSFHQQFDVWRIPDDMLSQDLKSGNGFVVHIGVLRSS